MRVVRIFFGVLFLLGGAFAGGIALLEAGAMHGFAELNFDRLLAGDALVATGGCAAGTLLGILIARTGKGAAGVVIGVPLALAAVGVGAYGLSLSNHDLEPGIPYFAVAAVLAIVSAIFLSRRA